MTMGGFVTFVIKLFCSASVMTDTPKTTIANSSLNDLTTFVGYTISLPVRCFTVLAQKLSGPIHQSVFGFLIRLNGGSIVALTVATAMTLLCETQENCY